MWVSGVNWFGFNNKQTMPDGLWIGSTDLTRDIGVALRRMKALGFNTVRLPFNFKDFFEHDLKPRSPSELCTVTRRLSEEELKRSVVPDGVAMPSEPLPPLKNAPPPQAPSDTWFCNGWLPSDSVYKRFLAVLELFASNDFYVVIDDHLNTERGTSDMTVVEDPDKWVMYWARVAKDIVQNKVSAPWVLFDILNEPDCEQIGWERHPRGFPGMNELYLRAMDAIYQVHPKAVFLIEGCSQCVDHMALCWGDGFFTSPELCRMNGGQCAQPFFSKLLTKPYRGQVILSPHIYPPSVNTVHRNNTGKAQWERLTGSFGSFTKEGYSENGVTQRFPILYGETGFKIDAEVPGDMRDWLDKSRDDKTFMDDFAAWMTVTGAADDGKHNPTPNLTFWCWNPDSFDTGNMYNKGEADAGKIWWEKVAWMEKAAGLRPWYKYPGDYSSDGTTVTQPIIPTPVILPPAGDQLPNTPLPPPIHTLPETPFPPPAPKPAVDTTPVVGTKSPQVKAKVQEPWPLGEGFGTSVTLQVSPGAQRIDVPYTAVVEGPYTAVGNSWGGVASFQAGQITFNVTESYEALVPGGNPITLGFVAHGSGKNLCPSKVMINGGEAVLVS
eukprot:jgi/Botrbrau1/4359/Bobra.105_2s0007.2